MGRAASCSRRIATLARPARAPSIPVMRVHLITALTALTALPALTAALPAQIRPPTAADSELVGRILLAEDRRDSTDVALAEGARNKDPRIRTLAQLARARIVDPQFVTRNTFPMLPAPPMWAEPVWRLRYRALTPNTGCGALGTALADSAWAVRLRAADLVTAPCAAQASVVGTLRRWVDALEPEASRRSRGDVSWHAAAHAIVALARIAPGRARARLTRLARHRQWQVRMYAARAAAVLNDTARLRVLTADPNDNVKAAAIESLAQLAGHADDDVFLAALDADGAQAVRAAAIALHGSPRTDVRAAANTAFDRWVARGNAPARDARVALLEAAGRPASDDHPPVVRAELPPRAIALALGANVRLRVRLASSSGGGAFVVQLRGDVAPMMAARVLALVHAHYYDGLTWQRVEPDFVIQGGSPGASEYIGFPQFFRDELGTVPHARGTVGMSTRGHDTGDGQWFINLKDNLRLGHEYTVFAEVIDGMDVVDGILEGDAISSVKEVHP